MTNGPQSAEGSQRVLNNRYKLLERLGTGGMASVYKAQDLLLGRLVAVKVLHETLNADPAFLRRFEREARAAAVLNHPNIVTVHDVGQDGDVHYIVMEYVDGEDLKTLIRSQAPLPVDRALELVVQICAGVGYAHRVGFVHCDVKPQNVLLTNDGRIKVADFGIARAMSSATMHTQTDLVWGSPHYFSPEQASGETPSPASDVYAIGIVLFELLSGRVPFEADSPTALALMHLREPPPPISQFNPQVPPALEQIINKVLSKEPASRYRTAEQFGRILETYRMQSFSQGTQALPPPVEVTRPKGQPTVQPRPSGAAPVPPAPQVPAARPAQHAQAQPGLPALRRDTPPPFVPPPREQTVVVVPPRQGREGPPERDYDFDVEGEGIDWLGILLTLIALGAVCGLIPLWTFVYLQVTGGTPPTPTVPPPTPIPAVHLWPSLLTGGTILPLAGLRASRAYRGVFWIGEQSG